MPDLVWGEPVRGGETVPGDRWTWLYRVKGDGTRRVARYREGSNNTGVLVRHDAIVPDAAAGCLPHKSVVHTDPDYERVHTSLPLDEWEAGRWLGLTNASGSMHFSHIPTTPGTHYYRIRRILGDHALRYIAEHNPSQLRYADPSVHRVETISHELTDQERVQAANTDEYIRGKTGFLWGLNELMRLMPANMPDLWKPLVDELDMLLSPYCSLCAGSGMSHRTIRKHPHEDWRKWQAAGLRFKWIVTS